MKVVEHLFLGLLAFALVLVVVGVLLPSGFGGERAITIGTSPEVVFDRVNTVSEWEAWSPWIGRDPTVRLRYNDIVAGVGAACEWESEDSGSGTLTIVESAPHRSIRTQLDFGEGRLAAFQFTFDEAADSVVVTWKYEGDAGWNLLGRYAGLVMDTLVAADFEEGLTSLKLLCESGS